MSDSSDPNAPDFYSRLGVDPSADEQQVKRAAQEAQKEYHPDHNPDPDSNIQFQRIREATECLTDSEKRVAYDEFYERFGSERAAEAYDRWTSLGRTQPPGSFSPGFSSTGGSHTSESRKADYSSHSSNENRSRSQRGQRSEQTGHHRRSADESTRNSQKRDPDHSTRSPSGTGTSSVNDSQASGSGSETGTSRQTHSNFEHRQQYTRKEYSAPTWSSLTTWPRIEIEQTAHEIAALIVLGVATAIGLLLTTVLTFVLVLGVYIIGSVIAIFEYTLRAAGVAQFNAYTVTEIGLTWILEIGVYVGILFVAMFLFQLSFDRDWEAQLGNRLGIPQLILLLPVSLLVGYSIWVGRPTLASHIASPIESRTGFILIGALWPALSRSTRLLLESSPNHNGESILDSAGSVLHSFGAGSLLLAAYLLGGLMIVGSDSNPLEYTLIMKHLSPRLLLGVGFSIIAISLAIGILASILSYSRKIL